jgi:hypothetical protein
MLLRFLLFFGLLVSSNLSYGQFWSTLQPIEGEGPICACFSQDEKNIYFVSKEGGVANVFKVPVKGGAPMQVTKFVDAPVVRAMHIVNRPLVVYMRSATPGTDDYHIYRIADDGSGEPLDVTPSAPGVRNEIIGASYNGRYIYYRSNKINRGKWDTYRYDVQQNLSELIFPNDKDFKVLAWSRDHGKLLIEDPSTGTLYNFDITTTERTKLAEPQKPGEFRQSMFSPSNKEVLVLAKSESAMEARSFDISGGNWKTLKAGDYIGMDFSINGKYTIIHCPDKTLLTETSTGTEITLPQGAKEIMVAPKETQLLYTIEDAGGGKKLFLYDIPKAKSTELALVR